MSRRPVSGAPRVRCALLAWHRFEWLCEACLHCPGLELCTLDPERLGLADAPNPFGLELVERVDVALVSTAWYQWLALRHPDRLDRVFAALERDAGTIVGVESSDELQLGLPPAGLARMACVIKGGGLYRDRDLYNYEVGPRFPDARWTERVRPRESHYAPPELEKLRLSIPCFLWVAPAARRRLRARREEQTRAGRILRAAADGMVAPLLAVAGARGARPHDVHCVGSLSHVQRLDALRLLDGLGGHSGLTGVPERVSGLAGAEPFWHGEPLTADARRTLTAQARPYLRAATSRVSYQLDLTRHRVAVAPCGHGELTYRHAEALAAGAALVCQDLSHAETMFPFADRANVFYCRPDLSDLRSLIDELLCDERLRRAVAAEGRRVYRAWTRRWREHLLVGVQAPIFTALGVHTPFT
jgi:Glycosyl transferases group 1